VVQPDAPPQHEPVLKTERILMVDFTSTQAMAMELAPPVHRGEAQSEGVVDKSPSTPPPLIADGVDRMYRQLAEIQANVTVQLVECAHWRQTNPTPCSALVGASRPRPDTVPSVTRLTPLTPTYFSSQAPLWP
jgi:hypothetical protein